MTRSQTTVEARWQLIPTESTAPVPSRAILDTSKTASAISTASNSTNPCMGVLGSTWR